MLEVKLDLYPFRWAVDVLFVWVCLHLVYCRVEQVIWFVLEICFVLNVSYCISEKSDSYYYNGMKKSVLPKLIIESIYIQYATKTLQCYIHIHTCIHIYKYIHIYKEIILFTGGNQDTCLRFVNVVLLRDM